MVDINIPIKLITQRYQYLLITPRAHPNKCSQVKRKETHKSPLAHLMATSTPARQPQKTTKNHNGNNPKPQKEQKTGKKIDFFLTVSSCVSLKKQP